MACEGVLVRLVLSLGLIVSCVGLTGSAAVAEGQGPQPGWRSMKGFPGTSQRILTAVRVLGF
jgi:hypothetical protein